MRRVSILLLFMLLLLSGCSKGDIQKDISENIEIDVNKGTVLTEADSHGGFHGDGITMTQISFDDGTVLDAIENNDHWNRVPLSKNITALVYGIDEETSSIGPYLTDENGNTIIPEIQNGYYYFYDRHSESKDPYSDEDVLGRASFNFTLALYDSDNNVLYYVEFDT